jgi:hypothetical protein
LHVFLEPFSYIQFMTFFHFCQKFLIISTVNFPRWIFLTLHFAFHPFFYFKGVFALFWSFQAKFFSLYSKNLWGPIWSRP